MSPTKAVEMSGPSRVTKDYRPESADFIVVDTFSVEAYHESLTLASASAVLGDLAKLTKRAQESGLPAPADALREKAATLVHLLPHHAGLSFQAYSMSGGEIVLSASSKAVKGSVLLTLSPDGPAWCNVRINGEPRRAWYSNTRKWPDGFIMEALAEMATSRATIPFPWQVLAKTTWRVPPTRLLDERSTSEVPKETASVPQLGPGSIPE